MILADKIELIDDWKLYNEELTGGSTLDKLSGDTDSDVTLIHPDGGALWLMEGSQDFIEQRQVIQLAQILPDEASYGMLYHKILDPNENVYEEAKIAMERYENSYIGLVK